MRRLKSNEHYLHILKRAKNCKKIRAHLLNAGGPELVKTLIECVINTLNGNHKVSKNIVRKLRRHQHCMQSLAYDRLPLHAKKELIVQKGGFLGILLGTLLSGLVGNLLNRGQ